ncbi:MAG: DUF5011 domain-containing protein [Cyclobacteriaceae bacterium]
MNKFLKNAFLVALLATTAVLMSCTEDEDDAELPAVVASFTQTTDSETGTVTFLNTSENATIYAWDFGDGTSSTLFEPSKMYSENGTYTVVLTASNAAGDSDVAQADVVIDVVVADTEAPVITLLGDAEVTITVGDTYEDAGATANDNADGDITSSIVVTGTVDEATAGTYTLNYNVSDAAGNAATEVSRTVIVIEKVRVEDGLLTNGDFEDGPDNWFTNYGDNVPEIRSEGGNSYFFAEVTAANSGEPFAVNLSQIIEITPGESYVLSFEASSDRARTIIAGIGLNEDPWSNATEVVNLTTESQVFTLKLTAAGFGIPNSRVLFDLNAENGVVVIDNVRLDVDPDAGGGGGGSATPIVNFENALAGIATGQFGGGVTAQLIANPVSGGINTSANVFQVNYTSGSEWWGGTELDFGTGVLDASATVYKAKLYSTVANSNVLFQVETASNVGTTGEVQTIVNANEWVEVTFTMPNPPAQVNRIIIRPDVSDQSSTKANTGTLYIDDIVCESCTLGSGGGGGGGGGGGDCPAPPAGDLISNGGFESGEACWQFDVFPGSSVSTTVSSDGSNSAELQGATGQAVGLKQERFAGGVLQPSTTYTVTFDIQADGPFGEGGILKVFTFSEGVDGGTVGATQHVLADAITSLSTTWEQKSYNFTTPATAPQVEGGLSFYIEIVNSSAKINLDNVSIK